MLSSRILRPDNTEHTYALPVVTINASGLPYPPYARRRMKELARQIEAMNVDLVNLQEVHTYGLVQVLKHHLNSFPHVAFMPSVVGPKAGLITFSKTPINQVSFFSFSESTRRLGRLAPRRAVTDSPHKGVLIMQLAGRPTTIINTHMSSNTDGDWSKTNQFYPVHRAQLNFLQHLAHQAGSSGADVVLSGDLNLAKDCDLYEEFVEQGKWLDPFLTDMSPTFHGEFLSPDRKPRRVDYIFGRGQCRSTESARLFTEKAELGNGKRVFLSNHMGLRTRLVFTLR